MGEGFVVLQSQVCKITYLQDEPGTMSFFTAAMFYRFLILETYNSTFIIQALYLKLTPKVRVRLKQTLVGTLMLLLRNQHR